MEYAAGNCVLEINGNLVSITAAPAPRRTATVFYAVIFSWFIYLFAVRVLKVYTSVAFNWFMVLLLAAVSVYYLVIFMIWLFRKKRSAKYIIANILQAGVLERHGKIYAVWQMRNNKYITINFDQDHATAQAFLKALQSRNKSITIIGT